MRSMRMMIILILLPMNIFFHIYRFFDIRYSRHVAEIIEDLLKLTEVKNLSADTFLD